MKDKIMIIIFLLGIFIGCFVSITIINRLCDDGDNIYEELKFHGGLRFVKYDRALGKCFWNNQEIDCLRAGEYINKKPEAYACAGGSPTNPC